MSSEELVLSRNVLELCSDSGFYMRRNRFNSNLLTVYLQLVLKSTIMFRLKLAFVLMALVLGKFLK